MTKVDLSTAPHFTFKERHENDVDGSTGGACPTLPRRSA